MFTRRFWTVTLFSTGVRKARGVTHWRYPVKVVTNSVDPTVPILESIQDTFWCQLHKTDYVSWEQYGSNLCDFFGRNNTSVDTNGSTHSSVDDMLGPGHTGGSRGP